MDKKVFYKKFTKKRFGGGTVFLACHPDEVWEWFKEQLKDARIDENLRHLRIAQTSTFNPYKRELTFEKRIEEINNG